MVAYERGLRRRAVVAAGVLAVTAVLGGTVSGAEARGAAGPALPHADLRRPRARTRSVRRPATWWTGPAPTRGSRGGTASSW
ncbi:hypothetical protein ACFQ2B_19410 [Streptomyces stramineus]